MIEWKHRLYAFLLRRVFGPLLDDCSAQKLHDSINVNIEKGKFIMTSILLDANYLTDILSNSCPGLRVRKCIIHRLEINLSLRENLCKNETSTASEYDSSSFMWRAMKWGTLNESLPSVSLIADISIDDVLLEVESIDLKRRKRKTDADNATSAQEAYDKESTSKSIIESYVETALSTLQLNLKLTNIEIKLYKQNESRSREVWIAFKLSSLSYIDSDAITHNVQASATKKSVHFSKIIIETGETKEITYGSSHANLSFATLAPTTVALAEGSGIIILRQEIAQETDDDDNQRTHVQQDIEVRLDHHLNMTFDNRSMLFIQEIMVSMVDTTEEDLDCDEVHSSVVNPSTSIEDAEDLKALTGIMKQYREAYHIAKKNQLRGGILVPTNAYVANYDTRIGIEEAEDDTTFDAFFDANEKSFHNTAFPLLQSIHHSQSKSKEHETNSHIRTKLKFHLMKASLKINFQVIDEHHRRYNSKQEEYVLATLDDINLAIIFSKRMKELNLNIIRIQMDDAHLTRGSSEKADVSEIGRIINWSEDDSYGKSHVVVSEAPCVNLKWKSTRDDEKDCDATCQITFMPIEICFRQRTMANISKFVSTIRYELSKLLSSQSSSVASDPWKSLCMNIKFDCTSISIYLPMQEQIATPTLFEQSGEILISGIAEEQSIGLLFDNFKFQANDKPLQSKEATCSGGLTFQAIALFVVYPTSELGCQNQMFRKDVFVVNGRIGVNPSIPISINFIKTVPGVDGENFGRRSFPVVPAISSFKARQEDDDDDDIKDFREDSRGVNPEVEMLKNSEKSTFVITINVPELISYLTATELKNLLVMFKSSNHHSSSTTSKPTIQNSSSGMIAVAANLNLDKFTVVICDNQNATCSSEMPGQTQCVSFIVAIDGIKSHSVIIGTDVKHFRIFCYDFCLYSSCGNLPKSKVDLRQKPANERFQDLKNRIEALINLSVAPIMFRSHFFTPISQDTPSILVDLVDISSHDTNTKDSLAQNRVHLTFYHITYRYDVDSNWIKWLSNIFATKDKNENYHQANKNSASYMTRLFISCADINLDYQSPRNFKTISTSIIRIGDLRLSSNLMQPSGFKQAFSLSIGDVMYHIAPTCTMLEKSRKNENYNLCRSYLVAKEKKTCELPRAITSLFGTMPEAKLKELNFVNVLSLDKIDTIITLSKSKCFQEPPMSIRLSIGTLAIHSCKDSFSFLTDSVGELQAKLTALTDKDMEVLKSIPSTNTIRVEKQVNGRQKENTNGRSSFTKDISSDSPVLLLDGHEWTTIDMDFSTELVIPPGNEQIAGWYRTSEDTTARACPSKIIHRHFPLYLIEDSLSEGDMGARTLVKESAGLFLKSQVLIDKASLKVRFFDGYDWPSLCSIQQKEAAMRPGRLFIIEPSPAQRSKEGDDIDNSKRSSRELLTARKEEIMANLAVSNKSFLNEISLPEEKASAIHRKKHLRLNSRKSNTFFQISLNDIVLRMDSYKSSHTHRLQSVLEMSVSKLFVAETINSSNHIEMFAAPHDESEIEGKKSSAKPAFVAYHWKNDPQDTRFGTLMINMITWAPKNIITTENGIESDECDVTVQLLPMRCILDQRTISFVKAFFNKNDSNKRVENSKDWSSGLHLLPPPRFNTFKIKSWKVKVDYYPTRIDLLALREGSIVELVNLSPIHRMVITLSEVIVTRSLGLFPVLEAIVSSYIKEIRATQLHKFVANTIPFEAVTDVGQGLTDLVILPYDAFKQGDSIQSAMKKGMESLAETVVFQSLTTSSGLTKFAADIMAYSLGIKGINNRPFSCPKGIYDARPHAVTSLARGINTANYKVIYIPYREYRKVGLAGALTSVIKGIPVLLVAPLTGATEAASYTLLGARNALRPDSRQENNG